MNANRIQWLKPGDPPDAFPAVHAALAEPDGLLAAGGDLSTERLLEAYRRGIFPWYDAGQPILWWSPDPRCVIVPGEFHVARRFRRDVLKSRASIVTNQAFGEVIRACAAPRKSQPFTWLTDDMIAAYEKLHEEGWAHSIEVRDEGRLVGGVYGVALGRIFFGESMFSRAPNASKFALFALASLLHEHGFPLIDCQVSSGHLLRLGAKLMPRSEFVRILAAACASGTRFDGWPAEPLPVSSLPGSTACIALQ